MGASPNHRLSPEGARFLEWLNADRVVFRGGETNPTSGRPVSESDLVKEKYGRPLAVLAHYGSGTDSRRHMDRLRQQHPEFAGLKPTEILCRMLSAVAEEVGPFLFRLSLDPKMRKATWTMDFKTPLPFGDHKWARRDLERRPILYRLARFLADMLEKGPERLKPCAWVGCFNLFWDPTTNRQKCYCSEIHDDARALLRQAHQRTRRKKSRR